MKRRVPETTLKTSGKGLATPSEGAMPRKVLSLEKETSSLEKG